MDKYISILNNLVYITHINRCRELETDRKFCRHDMNHFLDVARIAMLISISEGIELDKDLIYSTALLHDIGRDEEYAKGIPHEEASAKIAEDILKEVGYDLEDRGVIIDAILNHGNSEVKGERSLRGIIYRADKLGRKCYDCPAKDECRWPDEKKNQYPLW